MNYFYNALSMNLHKFQEKANRLLYLYHSALRTIVNDNNDGESSGNNENFIVNFTEEIKVCKDDLMKLLDGDNNTIEELSDADIIIEDGKNFVGDALYFIDRILDA